MKIALFTNLDVIENNDNIFSVIKSLIKNKIEFEIDINSKISKSALQSANIEEDNIKNFVELNNSYDFAISVGGDGTILNSVEKIGELSIPIIGLNTGRLGFLANSSLKNIEKVINKLKNNDFNISKRSIIEVLFNGEKKYTPIFKMKDFLTLLKSFDLTLFYFSNPNDYDCVCFFGN